MFVRNLPDAGSIWATSSSAPFWNEAHCAPVTTDWAIASVSAGESGGWSRVTSFVAILNIGGHPTFRWMSEAPRLTASPSIHGSSAIGSFHQGGRGGRDAAREDQRISLMQRSSRSFCSFVRPTK